MHHINPLKNNSLLIQLSKDGPLYLLMVSHRVYCFSFSGLVLPKQTVQTLVKSRLKNVNALSVVSLGARKPVFGVCDRVRLKPAC